MIESSLLLWIEANGKTVPTAVVVHVDIARVEVHAPSVRRGGPHGGPIIPVQTYIEVIRAAPVTSCWNIRNLVFRSKFLNSEI